MSHLYSRHLRSRRDLFRIGALAAGATIVTGRIAQGVVSTATALTTPDEEHLQRSDLRADRASGVMQAGLPLYLTVNVSKRAGDTTQPAAGAAVDLWHCNAVGDYSEQPGESWLRGFQITDSRGVARFTTIYPGWHEGRTPHIHARMRSGGTDVATQFFFDDTISDYVYKWFAPYDTVARQRRIRNAGDAVYAAMADGDSGRLLLRLAEDAQQHAVASFDVVLP